MEIILLISRLYMPLPGVGVYIGRKELGTFLGFFPLVTPDLVRHLDLVHWELDTCIKSDPDIGFIRL